MRRLARENIGDGEYVFLHEPGQEADRDYGIHGKPAYFHIVHRAAADLPRYEGMEPIEAREPVAASGATMADVLGARPIGGRIAENMEGVACTNTANMPNTFDLQEKTIAPAIDYMGPDGLSQEEPSPGMRILMELRAKRQRSWRKATPT